MDTLRRVNGGYLEKDLRNRYRVAENNLRIKMDILNKAEKSELRMFEASKNRFQIKYSKFASNNKAHASRKRPKDTKRDVVQHAVLTSHTDEELYSQQLIEELLFADDEVDVDKLLCLHLLTTHVVRPGALLPSVGSAAARVPSAERDSGRSDRRGSPRSDARRESTDEDVTRRVTTSEASRRSRAASKLLPCYVINFLPGREVRKCWQLSGSGSSSGSLCNVQENASPMKISVDLVSNDSEADATGALSVFVNKQLEALISYVVQILQQVNPSKLDTMVKLARNPSSLVKLIKKPKIQEFFSFVKGKSITSSYSCFRKVCRKVCICACACTESELPTKTDAAAKHVISLNLKFDDSLKMLRNVLTGVRRNIHNKIAFDKDKSTIVKPEDMTNANIPNSFRGNKTSLLLSSASATGTGTGVTTGNSNSEIYIDEFGNASSNPFPTSKSPRVAQAKHDMLPSRSVSRIIPAVVSRDVQLRRLLDGSHQQSVGKAPVQRHREVPEDGSWSRGAGVARRSAREVPDSCSSSHSSLDRRGRDRSSSEQPSRHVVAAAETVRFAGYDAARLKVVITNKETDKKFQHFLRRTSFQKV